MKYKIFERDFKLRSVGRTLWSLFSKVPLFLRGPIVRRFFKFDTQLPPNLVFKRAQTTDEIEQSFKVAYEAYHGRNLTESSQSKIRLTKYHALPTTCILIAKLNEEVVATMTVIVDSAMGLPIEQLWSMSELRSQSNRMAEISNLAIKREFRSQRGKLLLPLCGFMRHFCVDFLGVDRIVATYHPEIRDFYKCVLLFTEIADGEIKPYEFVKGAAAVGGWLSFAEAITEYHKVYGTKKSSRNLYLWMVEKKISNYQFETKQSLSFSSFCFTPTLLEYFFNSQTEIFEKLTIQEQAVISNSYYYPEYLKIISKSQKFDNIETKRNQIRFAVNFNVFWRMEGHLDFQIGKVLEISKTGLQISALHKPFIRKGRILFLKIDLPTGRQVALSTQVKWIKGTKMGLELGEFVPQEWIFVLKKLEQEVKNQIESVASGISPAEKAS
jgi:hypothetical protein